MFYKQLPIFTDNIPFTGLQYAFFLSILKGNKTMQSILHENYFIVYGGIPLKNKRNLFTAWNDGPTLGYVDAFDYSSNIMPNAPFSVSGISDFWCKNVDLKSIIINALVNNKYLLIFVDEYYLKNCQLSGKEHFIHEQLIYGYDESTNMIITLGLDDKKHYREIRHSYDDFEFAYKKGFLIKKHGTYDWLVQNRIIEIYFITDKFIPSFDKNNLVKKIYEFTLGNQSSYDKRFVDSALNRFDFFWGIDCIDMCRFYFDNPYQIFRIIHHLYEHSIALRESLLFYTYNIENEEKIKLIIDEYNKKIIDRLSVFRSKCLKWEYLISINSEIDELDIKNCTLDIIDKYKYFSKEILLKFCKEIQY